MHLTLTEIPCSLFGPSEVFSRRTNAQDLYSGVVESRVLPKLVCEVGIICSLTGKFYKGPKLDLSCF